MADHLCGGRLADILRSYDAEGLSLRQITLRLYADHGVEVTHTTVGKWLANERPEAVAS